MASPPLDSNYAQMFSLQDQDVSAALFPRLVDRLQRCRGLGRWYELPTRCMGGHCHFHGGPVSLVCLAFGGWGEDQAKYSPGCTKVVMSSSGWRGLNWKQRRNTSAYPPLV